MANLRPIIVGFLVFGLFAIALITGGIQLAQQEGASQSIADSPSISSYAIELNSSLGNMSTIANSTETSFSNSPINYLSGFPVFEAITSIWRTLKVVPLTIYNLTIGVLFESSLGGEAFAIVLGVLGAILTITIIFAVWKMVSTGEGG